MQANKKILILTLNSGENELVDSIKMLNEQTYTNWNHKIFSNLSNKKAHEALYSFVMANSKNYDLFVKLDADMILANKFALANIVDFFDRSKNLDQANFAVKDVLSNSNIMALIVFSKKVYWDFNDEILFVDHSPTIRGKKLVVWGAPAPLAYHNPNPNPFQAFHFGAHRAMKAIQKGRIKKNTIQIIMQWRLLYRIWKEFKKEPTNERSLALLGAFSVWRGEMGNFINEYSDRELTKMYEKYKNFTLSESYDVLKHDWKKQLRMRNFLYLIISPEIIYYRLKCRCAVRINQLLAIF